MDDAGYSNGFENDKCYIRQIAFDMYEQDFPVSLDCRPTSASLYSRSLDKYDSMNLNKYSPTIHESTIPYDHRIAL